MRRKIKLFFADSNRFSSNSSSFKCFSLNETGQFKNRIVKVDQILYYKLTNVFRVASYAFGRLEHSSRFSSIDALSRLILID